MLRWPNAEAVDVAIRSWSARAVREHRELVRLGYFGSYATGRWGVGSDLDLVAVVTGDPRPFHERGRSWDLTDLPVPAEILVYTGPEWQTVLARGDRFARVMRDEVVWVVGNLDVR